MITVGGTVVIGEKGGATPDAVSEALKQILGGEAAGSTIVADGAGDLALTSADVSGLLAAADDEAIANALGISAPPAVTSITFADIGSKQFRIDVQTRVGGVLQSCALTHLRLTYLPLDPAQFGLAAGIQQENISPYFGGGNICMTSYMRAVADLNGLMRVEFTGQTAGRVITAEAWSDSPQSPHVIATHTVPA